MFNFTSLRGAQSSSPASQSILELDGGIKILIDVGWDNTFNEESLKELERQVPTLSLILLTHATTGHIGAFAHCCKNIPLFKTIPIYATTPVVSLGRALCQDLYRSAQLLSIIPSADLTESAYSFPSLWNRKDLNILRQPPSSEEIAGYFSLINQLKYSQSYQPSASSFSPPLNGLTITAHSAGHTLGGTIWHIQYGLESLVYAVDWNQAREHVLSGAAWLDPGGAEVVDSLRRPTALVCSSRASQRVALEGGRARRDSLLVGHIRETIMNQGTVLIPMDSSARVLELLYVLENAWAQDTATMDDPKSLRKAALYFAGAGATATIRYARSMLEWMEEGIVREFESAGSRSAQSASSHDNRTASKQDSHQLPFHFRFLKLVDRRASINRILSQKGPRVIVASDTSMDWGFSRDFVRAIALDPRSLIVLPERMQACETERTSIGRFLWSLYLQGAGLDSSENLSEEHFAKAVDASGALLSTTAVSTEQLQGEELALYQQFLARQRQLQNTMNSEKGTTLETSTDAVDDRSSTTSESSEESDTELQGKALNVSAALSQSRHKLGLSDAELGIDILIRRKGHHDYDVQGKKGREKAFPTAPYKKPLRTDDYGDAIRPEEYLRAEERDEVDEDAQASSENKESVLGQKRKWADVAARPGHSSRKQLNGMGKKQRQNEDALGRPDPLGGATLNGDIDMVGAIEDADEDLELPSAGPQKAVFAQETLQFNLRIAHVDFCGLHDKRSLQLLVPLIRPRKLILVGGEELETMALAEDCKRMLGAVVTGGEGSADVFTPLEGTTIDASVDTHAWILRASKQFAKQIHWQTVRGLGVVAVTGRMASMELEDGDSPAMEHAMKKIKTTEGKIEDARPVEIAADDSSAHAAMIDSLPISFASSNRITGQPFLHVGDLRLAELRRLMQSAGFAAEFRGEGTLVINGQVAVRKGGTGKLEVEGILDLPTLGGPDPTFYTVRSKVYEGLAIVSGG